MASGELLIQAATRAQQRFSDLGNFQKYVETNRYRQVEQIADAARERESKGNTIVGAVLYNAVARVQSSFDMVGNVGKFDVTV